MTGKLPNTCVLLCLLLSAACTSAPKPPTPPPTVAPIRCPLTPCRLPARPPLVANDDWRRAVDELEGELLSCAAQVHDCRARQDIGGAVE